MTCEAYEVLLEKRLSGDPLTPEEEEACREHEQTCPACSELRSSMERMDEELESLAFDVPPLPDGFHSRWVSQLEAQNMTKTTARKQTRKKPFFSSRVMPVLAAAAVLVFVIGGTLLTRDELPSQADRLARKSYASTDNSSAKDAGSAVAYGSVPSYELEYSFDEDAVEAEMAYEDALVSTTAMNAAIPAEPATLGDAGPKAKEAVSEAAKKIIRNGNLSIRTQSFDESLSHLKSLCESMGGWISYLSNYEGYNGLRHASLTMRIPSGCFDAFMQEGGETGRVLRREETAQDVTASYRDTETRLKTQQALMDRLQGMVTETAELSDLLSLESQIADTQYQIDTLQSSLNRTDHLVAYSTIDISLDEEKVADSVQDPELTFGERIAAAFTLGLQDAGDFLTDMLLFLVSALPFLIPLIVLIVVLVLVFRRRRKHLPAESTEAPEE